MARFLLIHGASHGAWCWRDLLPELTALRPHATAIDMPSHGSDPTPPTEVSLDDYAGTIPATLTADTILLGHSKGGFPVTLTAERAPEHIRAPVYLTACLPRHYILCTRDQAILPELQEKMACALPPGHVHRLTTGHSPFFAARAALARILNQIAEVP